MREVIRTNDLVVLSRAEAMLQDAGIDYILLDRHAGSNLFWLDSVRPRLMVESSKYYAATRTLQDGGLGAFIYEPD